ncbi:hypothetical protein MSAN_00641600 [Mycena sanguinolenta]|uniref:Uncharacterized protein n=1 Tax=Mycena sanguinolenta TaxID=230812 RepID=A0A8H6Z6F7_9AGAR|nr:hypothetical protein MSAN_00641600 [Mycena sanguinolenta]
METDTSDILPLCSVGFHRASAGDPAGSAWCASSCGAYRLRVPNNGDVDEQMPPSLLRPPFLVPLHALAHASQVMTLTSAPPKLVYAGGGGFTRFGDLLAFRRCALCALLSFMPFFSLPVGAGGARRGETSEHGRDHAFVLLASGEGHTRFPSMQTSTVPSELLRL